MSCGDMHTKCLSSFAFYFALIVNCSMQRTKQEIAVAHLKSADSLLSRYMYNRAFGSM